jgi:hypothetical protein
MHDSDRLHENNIILTQEEPSFNHNVNSASYQIYDVNTHQRTNSAIPQMVMIGQKKGKGLMRMSMGNVEATKGKSVGGGPANLVIRSD